MKWLFKIIGYSLTFILLCILLLLAYVKWVLAPEIPHPKNTAVLKLEREKVSEDFYRIGKNWLRKSKSGLWEEYIEGEPFERGVIAGKLNKELMYKQEEAFVEQIHKLIPNDAYLNFLGMFTRIFNRHLEENVPEENKLEIYGESLSAPHEFDFIAPAYDRMLNYHAAHDIGHALQSLALVGCTSFAAWDERSADSSLIIGRNFDFYVGDKFAEDKIVYFCKPSKGNKFVMITWGGFMGCVSGMNEKGLTVTLNAAKSDMPTGSATPISILGREILQYASNINEAYSIAKKGKTFVSESFMIGSAADHKTALIEKSTIKTALYFSDTNYILCSNHYQSDSFKNDKNNIENMATSASVYRYKRLQELMNRVPKFDYLSIASILRNQEGQNDKNIGMGNEKALNQLIAHHSVIFEPEKKRFWVSSAPFQLGEFICYDLNKIFADTFSITTTKEISETAFNIPADTFLLSNNWKYFLKFKEMRQQLKDAIKMKESLKEDIFLSAFQQSNPEFWETYYWIAEYYKSRNKKTAAIYYYKLALSKEVNAKSEVEKMNNAIQILNAGN